MLGCFGDNREWVNSLTERNPTYEAGDCTSTAGDCTIATSDHPIVHPLYMGKITVSGKDSSDAKPYQEKEVLSAIQAVEETPNDE